jgi:hypothetical protein
MIERFRAWKASAEQWLRAQSAVFLILGILSVIAVLYVIMQSLKLDADSVAAAAAALAAVSAMIAARQSAATAKDATRALALATKPVPELRMNFERSESDFSMSTMSVDVENLSLHPIKSGTLRWLLRDGSSGSHPVGEILGRKTPFGGMFHRAEGVETLVVATSFDDGVAGVDRVTLDYSGGVRDITWRSTLAIEWEVVEGGWSEKDGVRVANTKRNRHDRTEIEL